MTLYLLAFIAVFGIGFVAGLRALTGPAVVSWAAWLGYLHLGQTPLAFMGSLIAVSIFTVMATGEYIGDKLPKTPSRTDPPGLIGRILTGGLAGASLHASMGNSLLTGGILGAAGAVLGAFGGYHFRTRAVKSLGVKDIFVAVPEDLFAICLGIFFIWLSTSL